MRSTDKYVIIFAIGIVALIVVALAVAAMQPEKTYLEGDGPEAVAHNYLLALEEGDLDRAYSYLSPDLKGYPPDVRTFRRNILRDEYQFPSADNSAAMVLDSVEVGEGWATAYVRMTANYGGGLFGLGRHTDEFDLQLERTGDGWKIVDGRRLFLYCWAAGDCN